MNNRDWMANSVDPKICWGKRTSNSLKTLFLFLLCSILLRQSERNSLLVELSEWRAQENLVLEKEREKNQKFQTLFSILLWSKFGFLCSCFLKYLVEWQKHKPRSGAVWSECTFRIFYFVSHFGVWKFTVLGLHYLLWRFPMSADCLS